MKNIKRFLIGIILGIANIIPGVSGGTLAMSLGIYEDIISIISNIFKDFKKNILFLLPIGIGIVLSILLLSKVINYTLEHYEFETILLFVGLILGGIPSLLKNTDYSTFKPKNILISLICFSIIFGLAFIGEANNEVTLNVLNLFLIIKLFIVGVIASATMIIPGVSGSFVLMLMGYYKPIVETISNLTNYSIFVHNVFVLIPFLIGVLVGIVLIARLIKYLLNRFRVETYYGIYGIILASIVVILMSISFVPGIIEVLIGLCLLLLGFRIGYELS